jgi:hypothetical protein
MNIVDAIRRRFNPNDIHYIVQHRFKDQQRELTSILRDADAIEKFFQSRNLPLPVLYNLCTMGFNPPNDAEKIGEYGKGIFSNFVPPEIPGHEGTVSYQDGMMFFYGRVHPNEWAGNEKGPMIVTHQLNVIKELIRRQRTKDGVDPLVVLTYVVGVREGHALKPGDLGLILDDTELTNIIHPGHGPRALLDQYEGSHFQAKAGRSSNLKVAKAFVDYAKKTHYDRIFPAITVGTPGTTEYQSFFEVALLDKAFDRACRGNLKGVVNGVFGEDGSERLSLLFDMGITSELATIRQRLKEEKEFNFIAFGLGTDLVGGKQSLEIDHDAVFAEAIAKGEYHRDQILNFARQFSTTLPQTLPDYSLKTNLEK